MIIGTNFPFLMFYPYADIFPLPFSRKKIKMNTALLAPENIIYFSFFYFRKESFLLPKTKQSTRKISFSTG